MARKKTKTKKIQNKKEISNGIGSFTQNMLGGAQLSQTDTMGKNNRYYYIFNNRILLNTLYIEHGIIQTLIDQPVDDAFRGGIEIKSNQLDDNNISELKQKMDTDNVLQKIGQTIKWGRLFGGGGLVIVTSQDPEKPFNINKVNEFTPIDFYPADLWELNLSFYSENPTEDLNSDTPYMFYGKPLHESRVLKFKGKEAPSMMRRRFRGWGMTEVERLIRSFNQYLKNNDVIFDLLDEAKVDVYKLENYNTSMLSNQEGAIQDQIQMSNMLKNYLNALVMDKEDDYEQKQVTFAGLGDMLGEIRKGIASDVKIPVTKLFGVSSAGFNSGEDDIENYNSMVDGEVRSKSKSIVIETIRIYCQKLFGFVPEDIEIEWKPLRVLNSEQEENVKNAKANRLLSLFSSGLVDTKTAKEVINRDDLISVDVKIDEDLNEDGIMQESGASSFLGSSNQDDFATKKSGTFASNPK
jgi:phage-related protein (TIGR01555 family)